MRYFEHNGFGFYKKKNNFTLPNFDCLHGLFEITRRLPLISGPITTEKGFKLEKYVYFKEQCKWNFMMTSS